MRFKRQPGPLQKRARRGFRGYPAATIAFYGPDASRASKIAVGIILEEGGSVDILERWFSDTADLRIDHETSQAVLDFIRQHQVKSVVLTDTIIGCPHEEGIDYPEGEPCPQCPYWRNRDRWTGEALQ